MKIIPSFLSGKKVIALLLFLSIFSAIFAVIPTGVKAARDATEYSAIAADPSIITWTKFGPTLVIGLAKVMAEGSYQIAAYSSKLLSWVISDIVGKNITNDASFKQAWKTARDLGNMVIVLIFVVIGISIALRIQEYGSTKLLFHVIIVAILINFSGLFCGLIIDAANITMTGMGATKSGSMPATILHSIQLQSMSIVNTDENGKNSLEILTKSAIYFPLYLGVAFTFLYLSLILIARYAILIFLYILSPLAFALSAFPATKKMWNEWKDNFLKWSFIGVFGTLVLVLSTSLLNNAVGASSGDLFVKGVVFLMFLFAGFKMTAQQGGIAAMATGAVTGLALGAGKLAMGATAGTAGLAGKLLNKASGGGFSTDAHKLASGTGKAMEFFGLRATGVTAGKNQARMKEVSGRIGNLSEEQKKSMALGKGASEAERTAAVMDKVKNGKLSDLGDHHTQRQAVVRAESYAKSMGMTSAIEGKGGLMKTALKQNPNIAKDQAELVSTVQNMSPKDFNQNVDAKSMTGRVLGAMSTGQVTAWANGTNIAKRDALGNLVNSQKGKDTLHAQYFGHQAAKEHKEAAQLVRNTREAQKLIP